MSTDPNSYQAHKDCTAGDIVKATTEDGQTFEGTVMKTAGATVYVQSNSNGVLEFRRLKDDSDPVIVLAIDGKDVGDTTVQEGVNKDGTPMTVESTTLSFDTQVSTFKASETEHKLG